MPLDVVVDCPGFAESRHAVLAYDAVGALLATQLSEGASTVVLHVVSPSFPLRLVVTGARCSFATTVDGPATQLGVLLPSGTLLHDAEAAALNPSVPCVEAMSPWLAGGAPDLALERIWARCTPDSALQARIDTEWASLPASLLAWEPLYTTHEAARVDRLFRAVRDNPAHEAAPMLQARLARTASLRPWRAILAPCSCPEPKPTVDIGGAVLLRGEEAPAIERAEPPGVVVCACDGRILWGR